MTSSTAPHRADREAEVTRYCAWPTQASSYLTGCLEIVRIREAFFEAHGSRDTDALRAFHDGITSCLPTPRRRPADRARRAVRGAGHRTDADLSADEGGR